MNYLKYFYSIKTKISPCFSENTAVYNSLALANIHLNNLDEAENFVKLALSYEPNSEYNLMQYSMILLKKELYERAIEKANEILEINPQSSVAIYYKGCAFANMKKYKEAEFFLKQALQINPNLSSIHLQIADVYSDTKQNELAEQEYLEALKLEPNNSTVLNNYGLFVLKQNRFNKRGIELLKSSLRNNPNDKIVIHNYKIYLAIQKSSLKRKLRNKFHKNNYKIRITTQSLFITFLKYYKNLFEGFCPPEHIVSLIVILLICYFLDYELFIRACTIMAPFTVLYIIALICLKYDKFVNSKEAWYNEQN